MGIIIMLLISEVFFSLVYQILKFCNVLVTAEKKALLLIFIFLRDTSAARSTD